MKCTYYQFLFCACWKYTRSRKTGLEFMSAEIDASFFSVTPITTSKNIDRWPFPHVSHSAPDLFCAEPYTIVFSWIQLSVEPSKYRNLMFVKRRILNDNALSIKVNKIMHAIPPITEKPVRFVGKQYQSLCQTETRWKVFLCLYPRVRYLLPNLSI